ELRDASHLLGKDTWETTDLIKSENGQEERGMSVVSIGPAGENLVRFASIFADKGHAASHDGVGAVLGSKKLKAIAVVRGRGRPRLKDREVFSATAKQYLESVMNDPRAVSGIYTWGTLTLLTRSILAKDGSLPVKNYTTNIYDIEPEKLEKFGGPYIRSHFEPKPSPCWGCRFHHCHMITLTEGPFKGYVAEEPEYEGFAAFGPVIGVTDVTAAIFLSNEADRLGIDVNETSWTIGLAIECYEKGLLTREDTDQIELTWGNYGAVNQLLNKIATRQGFGNVLAEGAMRVARSIGGEATNFAIHTMKGNTPRGHDHRNRWPMLFDTCLSQMSTDEGRSTLSAAELGLTLDPKVDQSQSVEYIVASNVYGKGDTQFEDSLGVCRFTCRTDLKLHSQAVSAATGWDFSIEEAKQVGKRIVNLLRAFNIRHGHTAEMDAPSPRYGSAPVDGPSQGKTIMVHWPELRRKYYEQMGWDGKTGKPLPDTLRQLGLAHTIPELWGR
ncbi:MAG: aldehyde ferredoxin oxidoreductase C-terminal domain-containing protein, partial [Dehalococcoidales bacterium]|nr:aldehyde ferredoxin oxidoreductase C-terminal domain-containing protein [Dehalococcoidales bacterium]